MVDEIALEQMTMTQDTNGLMIMSFTLIALIALSFLAQLR